MNEFAKTLWILSLILIINACDSGKNQSIINLPEIKIDYAFTKNRFIEISKIVEGNIEYIPLESTEDFILASPSRVYLLNSKIIVFAPRQIFLYDRVTGKCIKEIGKHDRGPAGYMATLFSFPFDPVREVIIARGWDRSHLKYNLKGDYLGKVVLPEGSTEIGAINDTISVAFIRNFLGNENRRLIVFTNKNEIIKSFPNYKKCEPSLRVIVWGIHGWFYRFQEELRFFELFTDTIYQVKTHELIPKYVLQMGEFAPPYEKQNTLDFNDSQNYFFIRYIFESEKFLFYEFRHDNKFFQGVYNKKTNSTYIAHENNGFENDIDNFIPLKFTSVSSQGELIGVMEAWEVEQWFKNNPDKAAKLPPHLKKLEKITENDNPVVMIARLKE